jgi:hypothetical protein
MAGPFYIFGGMGTGKDSGKLLFKSLTSSNSSVNIFEDETGITFSSAGGGGGSNAINKERIVWGTGTGITSSYCSSFFGYENILAISNKTGYESIYGPQIWSVGVPDSSVQSKSSIVVGGRCGCIQTSSGKDNILVGGYCNSFSTSLSLGNNAILGGCKNNFCLSSNSVIMGGGVNRFSCQTISSQPTSNSVIIGSGCVRVSYGSDDSTIISSSFIGDVNNNSTDFCTKIQQTTLMSSLGTCISEGNPYTDSLESSKPIGASLISTISSRISSKFNSLISFTNGSILGSASVSCRNTYYNSIISQNGGCIVSACLNSMISNDGISYIKGLNNNNLNTLKCFTRNILNSTCNSKIFFENEGVLSGACVINSSIIGGRANCIGTKWYSFSDTTFGAWRITKSNLIFSGATNSILSSCESSILQSGDSRIDKSLNSSIISSVKSCIGWTSSESLETSTSIISSENSYIAKLSCRSVIIASCDSKIKCSQISSIIGSTNSSISQQGIICCGNNSIISSSDSTICTRKLINDDFGRSNLIISGRSNCIEYNNFSSIVGGCCNKIYEGAIVSGSLIIAGCCNLITMTSPITDNVIIGGRCNRILGKPRGNAIVGGCKNCIPDNGETVEFATIVGGSYMCNRFSRTTMIRGLAFSGCSWVKGFTGSTGTFSSGGTICLCCGLVVCII